jgi:hypothetical protein
MCTLECDDLVRVYAEDPRIARKEHSCLGCGATIHRGDAYNIVFYVSDGHGYSEKECFPCWWTRTDFWEAHSGGPFPSNLWEELKECIQGDHSSPWRAHLAALKRRWRTSPIGRRVLRKKAA